MADLRILDWKPSKKGDYQTALVKKGYTRFGELRKHPGGVTVFWVPRNPDETMKPDCWAIEAEVVSAVKTKGAKFVMIEVSSGDKYLTRLEAFADAPIEVSYERQRGTRGKAGIRHRCLPFSAFAKHEAPPESAIRAMRIKGIR